MMDDAALARARQLGEALGDVVTPWHALWRDWPADAVSQILATTPAEWWASSDMGLGVTAAGREAMRIERRKKK